MDHHQADWPGGIQALTGEFQKAFNCPALGSNLFDRFNSPVSHFQDRLDIQHCPQETFRSPDPPPAVEIFQGIDREDHIGVFLSPEGNFFTGGKISPLLRSPGNS